MDQAAVWAEYERLGYKAGWVFAMTPFANLATARAMVIGLNPGGPEADSTEGTWEPCDPRNAYFYGRWYTGAESDSPMPIQVQVMALHALLGLEPEDVFAAQFIPFRSQTLISLGRKAEALKFARALWSWVLPQSPAKLFICMGGYAAWQIADLLGAKPQGHHPSGWGSTKVGRYVSDDGKVVVELPHPSRYRLLTMREPAKLAMARDAIRQATRPA